MKMDTLIYKQMGKVYK